MKSTILEPGTYDQLRIAGTRLEPHKVDGEPKIVVVLEDPAAEPGEGAIASDWLYTSNAAWDAVTEQRLKNYGWDPAANDFALSFFANQDNNLIGKLVGPVVLVDEPYNGKSQVKVARVGDEKFGKNLANDAAKAQESEFQRRMRMRLANKFANALPSHPPAPAPATASDDPF